MHNFTENTEKRIYGCLFCASGREDHIASILELDSPGLIARSVKAVKRRSTDGVKWYDERIILPGYVFYSAPAGFRPGHVHPDGLIRYLTTVDGDIALSGGDEKFARWILRHNGLIGLSRAMRTENGVELTSGPLFELLRFVQKIDKRNKNALVHLEFYEQPTNIWLPFEFEES